jgi:long-chain acyl-CoA synthetase
MSAFIEPNLATLLWSTTRTHAASPAVVECGREFSYAALCNRAASVAAALAATGLKPNERVAILLENSMDAVAAFFGVLAAGGIAVVINDALR